LAKAALGSVHFTDYYYYFFIIIIIIIIIIILVVTRACAYVQGCWVFLQRAKFNNVIGRFQNEMRARAMGLIQTRERESNAHHP
jgi:flagellar basal body-associated protein FliL